MKLVRRLLRKQDDAGSFLDPVNIHVYFSQEKLTQIVFTVYYKLAKLFKFSKNAWSNRHLIYIYDILKTVKRIHNYIFILNYIYTVYRKIDVN